MDKRTIALTVTLFALIVAGMFVFAYLKRSEQVQVVIETPTAESDVLYPDVTRIDAKHFYNEGAHTFVGEIQLPTPCDLLEGAARVMESYPEQIVLDFNVINNADSCAQVITSARFYITATASDKATVSAVFMGRPVELNLVPAAPGETPEDFELFIKG